MGLTWDEIIPLLIGFHRIASLELELSERSLNSINPQTWLALGRTLSGVVSLSLMCFKQSDVPSLARAICAFPCLRELSIFGYIESTFPELVSSATFQLSPYLHTLELDVHSATAVVEWFLSRSFRPTIRTARLYYLEVADLAVYHKLIGAFGNDLESLSLSTYLKGN
jgi:hypothetical protein